MNSDFKEIWKNLLKIKKMPSKYTGVKEISYNEFKKLKDEPNLKNTENLINDFLNGKVLIVKNVFDVELVKYIKKQVVNFWKNNPNTYFKLVEKCPDFHRVIPPDLAKNYSVVPYFLLLPFLLRQYYD